MRATVPGLSFLLFMTLVAPSNFAQTCPAHPPFNATMSYSGSRCTSANGLPCVPGQPVTFTWNGEVQSCDLFHWDFGDGTTADVTGSGMVTHTFSPGPSYTVTLTIQNAAGSNMGRVFLDVDNERFCWASATRE